MGQFRDRADGRPFGNVVAIAPTWALGCGHARGGGFFTQGGTTVRILERVSEGKADLALYRLEKPVKHFSEPFYSQKLRGRVFTMVGYGESGLRFDWGWDGRRGTAGVKRSATNTIDLQRTFSWGPFRSVTFEYDLDSPSTKGATPDEGGIAKGDSGCAWFVQEAGRHRVIAVGAYALGNPNSKSGKAYEWGAKGLGVSLTAYKGWIQATIAPSNASKKRP